MATDPYEDFAARYDWMTEPNPERERFFQELFARHQVASVLDCACGTGRDLTLFHSLGLHVQGLDLSEAMLAEARRHIAEAEVDIPVSQADYRELPQHTDKPFDAVVCLSNAINELLDDAQTLRALRSMHAVLRRGGILVFDQGQTDATMEDPPPFAPIVNTRDVSRLFVMEYAGNIQTVHIFDFVHTHDATSFHHASVRIRIRLRDSWEYILGQAGFSSVEFYGSWDGAPYDKAGSRRLIGVARK